MSWKTQFKKRLVWTFLVSFGVATLAMPVMAMLAANSGDYDAALEFSVVGMVGAIMLGGLVGISRATNNREGEGPA